jgi:hypothetical protein
MCGQLHASGALPPGKKCLSTHWVGGWVDLRAGLDAAVKRWKFTAPAGSHIELIVVYFTGSTIWAFLWICIKNK